MRSYRAGQSHGPIDIAVLLTVGLNRHPVLLIEVKLPSAFRFASGRREADDQMQQRFLRLRHCVATPRHLGINAFGTRLAFSAREYMRVAC